MPCRSPPPVVDVLLEVLNALLVGPTGVFVERRADVAADIDTAGELEAVHLLLWAAKQDRQVVQPLAVAEAPGGTGEGDGPRSTFIDQHGSLRSPVGG